MPNSPSSSNGSIDDLLNTVQRLRSPGGCPWDLEQTHATLRPHLIEEAYEVMDILDRLAESDSLERLAPDLKEELGDLLMQVVLHAQIASESGHFDFAQIAHGLNEKLIRRHPHVFGDESERVDSAEAAYGAWEKQKAKEGKVKRHGRLASVPKALPALQRASRIIDKVTRVGFQWNDLRGPVAKIREELAECLDELGANHSGELEGSLEQLKSQIDPNVRERLRAEIGDLLFSVVNFSYLLGIPPEDALRENLIRFERRFRFIEKKLEHEGQRFDQLSLEELDKIWNEAKLEES